MKFTLKKIKVNINELEMGSCSLVGIGSLFFPCHGNYFSLKYKDKRCNIMNISYEDFNEIKRRGILKKCELVEVIRKDNTETNGYLLFIKDLEPEWYLSNLWLYSTNIKSEESKEIVSYLNKRKYAIDYIEKFEIKREMIEEVIISKTNNFYSNHEFNYINENDFILKKTAEDLKDKKFENHDRRVEGDYKIIDFIDKLSLQYKLTYTNFLNLYSYCKTSKNYFEEKILGYSYFDRENKTVRHYIKDDEKLISFLTELHKYDIFSKKCENLTKSGINKFHELLKEEKEKNYQMSLNGQGIDIKYLNIHLKEMLNSKEGIGYIEYKISDSLDLNLNKLVEYLKTDGILKSDNQEYSKNKQTTTFHVCVYFYELKIEEEISENEFIARLSSNDRTFYYARFYKEDENWNCVPVRRKTETVFSYS